MAVDVSHSGDQTTLDAFEVTKKPALLTNGPLRRFVAYDDRPLLKRRD